MPVQPEAELRSGCKLNLFLKITGTRPDGYHTLRNYMLPLLPQEPPFDVLRIRPGKGTGLQVVCSEPGIDPLNNTLTRAYGLLAAERRGLPALRVELVKGVPHGAGLGGGSADAATLLLYLNGLLADGGKQPLGRDELIALAARIGADVPFFILNIPAWAAGIGEVLSPAEPPWAEAHLALVCPDIKISTAWAFREWDKREAAEPEEGIVKNPYLTSHHGQDSNFCAAGFKLFNSLEQVVFRSFPELLEIRNKLTELGASAALMSGSGSSIFGLFPVRREAEQAAVALRKMRLTVYTRSFYTGASPSW